MATSFSEKLTAWIIAHQWLVLPLVALVSLGALSQLRFLEISGDIGAYVDGSGADVQDFNNLSEKFGNYETFVFVVQADDVLAPGVLQVIGALTDILQQDIDVRRVVSLARLPVAILGGDDNRAGLSSRQRDDLLGNPYLGDYLVSTDGTQTQLFVMVDATEIELRSRLDLAQRLRDLADTFASASIAIDVTGPSVVAIDAMDMGRSEFVRVLWLVPLLLGGVILFVFQRHVVVLAPVLIVGIAILWTLAAFTLAGNKISMMTSMMPVIIAVITIADVIHILHKYYSEAAVSDDRQVVVLRTMGMMNGACFMTSVTTALGFLALLVVSSISIVQQFTIWTATGVLLAYVLIVTLMPIFLLRIPLPDAVARARYNRLPIYALVRRCYALALHRWRPAPIILLLLAILFVWGSTRLDVQTDMSKFLPADVRSIRTLALLQQGADGADSLNVVFDLRDGSFDDGHQLIELHRLEAELEKEFDEILSLRSLSNVVAGLHAADGHSGFPVDANAIEEYLLFIELTADEDWLRGFLSEDLTTIRIALQIEHADSRSTLTLIREIDDWLNQHVQDEWSVKSSGTLKLLVLNIQALVDSQLMSFLLALSVITLVMSVFLRDAVMSAISLIVNFMPVLLTMGLVPVLAAIGLISSSASSLNVSTVMVPSLAMAIAVDDTIHFLFYYRRSRASGASVHAAIDHALHGAGFAMIATTTAMVVGLAVLLLSQISANQEFSAMMCVALIAALVSDLLLLPHLIQRWKS